MQVAQPDGGGAKAVLSVTAPSAEIAWTPADQLLVVTTTGTWLVKPDGSVSAQLRSSSVGASPTWAPSGGRAALTRSGALWEVEIGTASSAALDLGAGDRVVAAYEKARISADTAGMHVKNLYTKLNVHDRTAAVAKAIRRGIIRIQ